MTYKISATTEAGQQVVSAAEALLPQFRERASAADAAGEVCSQNFKDLMTSKIAAAFVPEQLGGFGLESVHDWLTLIATLARGDGSTAIGINMHLGVSRGMTQAYKVAEAHGSPPESLVRPLTAIAKGKMLICATATERGTDNLHPLTEAVATEQGWRIDGQKMFVTMSPIATHLGMNLRMRDADGDHLVTTLLPIDTTGIVPQDDWDALGMRASGSQSVRFENVCVGKSSIRKLGRWGQWSVGVLVNRTLGNLPLVAAFLGIAEHAHELALEAVGKQERLGEPIINLSGVQHTVGELEIELATCRSILKQAGMRADEFLAEYSDHPPTLAAAHELMKDYQSAKWVVNRGAIDIVSKAMDLVGGGGFMQNHPLTRLYRDVRAGPFMQPFSPTEARQYVGQVALGLLPSE